MSLSISLLVMASLAALYASAYGFAFAHGRIHHLAAPLSWGAGAYAALALGLGWAPVLGICMGAFIFLLLRFTTGETRLVGTLALPLLAEILVIHLPRLGGTTGISSSGPSLHWLIIFSICMVCIIALWLAQRSFFGLRVSAAGQDLPLSQSLGQRPHRAQLLAVLMSSGLGAVAGGLWATFRGYADPSVFGLHGLILVLLPVLLGQGKLLRTAGLAAGLMALLELLRHLGSGANVGAIRLGLLGIVLLVFTLYHYAPRR